VMGWWDFLVNSSIRFHIYAFLYFIIHRLNQYKLTVKAGFSGFQFWYHGSETVYSLDDCILALDAHTHGL
jgi:hypothetical protein